MSLCLTKYQVMQTYPVRTKHRSPVGWMEEYLHIFLTSTMDVTA